MNRVRLPRASFGRLALRMGLVDQGQLRRALAVQADRGGSLEASLMELGVLTPELAEHVRAAVRVVLGR